MYTMSVNSQCSKLGYPVAGINVMPYLVNYSPLLIFFSLSNVNTTKLTIVNTGYFQRKNQLFRYCKLFIAEIHLYFLITYYTQYNYERT